MEVCRRSSWLLLLLGVSLLATTLQGGQGEVESEGPSESECRPYIEKALKGLETGGETDDAGTPESAGDSKEDIATVEITTDDDSDHQDGEGDDDTHEETQKDSVESAEGDEVQADEPQSEQQETKEETSGEADKSAEDTDATKEESVEAQGSAEEEAVDQGESKGDSKEGDDDDDKGDETEPEEPEQQSIEEPADQDETKSVEEAEVSKQEQDDDAAAPDDGKESVESVEQEPEQAESVEDDKDETKEDDNVSKESADNDTQEDEATDDNVTVEDTTTKSEEQEQEDAEEADTTKEVESKEDEPKAEESAEDAEPTAEEDTATNVSVEDGSAPVEELSLDIEIPTELRDRSHVEHLLKLDDEASETEELVNRVAEITLRELKKLYENAIKPLEAVYKYRDLSNRHFGDSDIFSKPLILFMGPWSGGKSSIINYLLNNEYNETSLRTGAEPSPAYFNILMHGEEPEIVDGTQLAADFTFSGLQKFGQGLEERLRGVKLPSKLLEKVNIVEIPGILEVRKQVSRVFPFNDACQWFIDRADIIFLVYDPSKLDVGPETEAILDQLKGREHQTRIVLNKADQVKPEELMRVQGALIWNISPLMSSAQPPIMYTTSLWSRPYEPWAPIRLLQAQERAFLRDLRGAVDKRIENKIASARRFAVRVRNHAKMVDCYLTTYYNHKSVFGNRKQVADEIIEHPQDYHIYEGLSTLTNISRYDLPDPDVYRDFFKLNPLYEFQQLAATCTYFRGCPINRLDVAIAYDLPELVGKHKRLVESTLAEAGVPTS